MEERTKTRNTILSYIMKANSYIIQASKSLFGNDETDYVCNSIDDIKSLDEYDLDAISNADRQTIEEIKKIEKEINKRKDQIKKSTKSLENQIENNEKSPTINKAKSKVAVKGERGNF